MSTIKPGDRVEVYDDHTGRWQPATVTDTDEKDGRVVGAGVLIGVRAVFAFAADIREPALPDIAYEATMSINDLAAAVERVQALCAEAESKGITSGYPFTVEAVRAALAGND